MRKLLAIQTAALGKDFAEAAMPGPIAGMERKTVFSPRPAVTCVSSAVFRTGLGPEENGVRANGWLDRRLLEPCFWKQPAGIVRGPRIWDGFRARGGRTAIGFIQQSLGERTDAVVSPAPIHRHGGGMTMDCYSEPRGFYETLRAGNGRDFALWRYWGPFAGVESSEWIARGFAHYISSPGAAEFVWCYLPGLDYDLQRYGPESERAARAGAEVRSQIEMLAGAAREAGYEILVFGDYAMETATEGASFPNRLLREAGLFSTRPVRGRLYQDFHRSAAFAVCDHQTAEVEIFDASKKREVRECLEKDPLAAEIEDISAGGEERLRLTAKKGAWFAYPWWEKPREEPDYASHVDIHSKPGFDPCELFADGWNPFKISRDTSLVRGTHGRASLPCAMYSTIPFPDELPLAGLSAAVRGFLES